MPEPKAQPETSPLTITASRSPRLKPESDPCAGRIATLPTERQHTGCYETLDKHRREIRLFELLPGEKDDPLRGRLATASLDADLQYDAVSYVWGDPRLRFPLIINDDQTILIMESLHVALPCLRLKDESRVLWIDAICINQGDDQERGHQVGMMKDVYSRARCVRIWMDVDVDLTSPAFHAAQQLQVSPSCFQFDDESSRPSDLGQTKKLTDHEPEFWAPIFNIFAHTYWERVWTQQELYLARSVRFHFPRGSLHPDVLIRFEWLAEQHLLRHNEDVYSAPEDRKHLFFTMSVGFSAMRKQYTVRNAVPTLLRLFLRSMDLKTSDPRDRVYGFVGLALDYHEGDFVPDYTLTRFQTYCLVVKHYIRRYQSVDFLCYYLSKSKDQSLPTWLPLHEALLLTTDFASKSTAVPVNPDIVEFNGSVMALPGIRCDRVTCRATDPNFCMTVSAMITQLGAVSADLGIDNDIFASVPFLELLESWLLCDVKLEDLSPQEFSDHVVDLISLVSSEGLDDSDPMDVEISLVPDLDDPETRILKFFILGLYRFVGTENKRLGASYSAFKARPTEPGDEIWVLFGCSMPMILRPKPDGHYLVIGPAVRLRPDAGGSLCRASERRKAGTRIPGPGDTEDKLGLRNGVLACHRRLCEARGTLASAGWDWVSTGARALKDGSLG